MGLFSEELKILDENTVKLMIDEMQDEINEQKAELDEKKAELEAALRRIAELETKQSLL